MSPTWLWPSETHPIPHAGKPTDNMGQMKPRPTWTKEAQLNMTADFLTSRNCLHERFKAPTIQKSQRTSISLNVTRLTSHTDKCIRYNMNGYHLRRSMQSKQRWTDKVWDSFDLDIFGKFFGTKTKVDNRPCLQDISKDPQWYCHPGMVNTKWHISEALEGIAC